jgi:hypothetical protein
MIVFGCFEVSAMTTNPGSNPVVLQTSASTPSVSAIDLNKVGEILIKFLVLSVIFEVALTPIFNWRIFIIRFDKKGYKTPITIMLALLTFWIYDLDIFAEILAFFGLPGEKGIMGKVITALLIAGGSSGVLTIFTKLGIRNPEERQRTVLDEHAELELQKTDPASI